MGKFSFLLATLEGLQNWSIYFECWQYEKRFTVALLPSQTDLLLLIGISWLWNIKLNVKGIELSHTCKWSALSMFVLFPLDEQLICPVFLHNDILWPSLLSPPCLSRDGWLCKELITSIDCAFNHSTHFREDGFLPLPVKEENIVATRESIQAAA